MFQTMKMKRNLSLIKARFLAKVRKTGINTDSRVFLVYQGVADRPDKAANEFSSTREVFINSHVDNYTAKVLHLSHSNFINLIDIQ
jgi:hypothetical protein